MNKKLLKCIFTQQSIFFSQPLNFSSFSKKLKLSPSHLFFPPTCRNTLTPTQHSKLHASGSHGGSFLFSLFNYRRATAATPSDQAWTHPKAKATSSQSVFFAEKEAGAAAATWTRTGRCCKLEKDTTASMFVNISAQIAAKPLVEPRAALTGSWSNSISREETGLEDHPPRQQGALHF